MMFIFNSVIFQIFLLILAAVIWFSYASIGRVLTDNYMSLKKKIGVQKPLRTFHCSAKIGGLRVRFPVFKVECYSEFLIVNFLKKALLIKYASNIGFTTTLLCDIFFFRNVMNQQMVTLYMYNKSNFAHLHRFIITSNAGKTNLAK